MLSNMSSYNPCQDALLLTSLAVLPDGGSLLVSSVYGGVHRIGPDGAWTRCDAGLPEGAEVYRLEADHAAAYACTSKGLWMLRGERWEPTAITVPCHRLRGRGGLPMAAADDGLWIRHGDGWVRMFPTDSPVYDLLETPQMIFMGREKGITLFDRYTQTADDFAVSAPVSGLTVLQGTLLGSAGGDLMVGNKRGGFDLVRYGRIKILSVAGHGGRVYACTDRGLYRILPWNGSFHLCSVKTGAPVTDLAYDGERLFLATYYEGVQTLPVPGRCRA